MKNPKKSKRKYIFFYLTLTKNSVYCIIVRINKKGDLLFLFKKKQTVKNMKLTVYENAKYALEESKKPTPQAGESLVKVKACGICGSDVPRIFAGKSYYYPIVLGHEFAGVVEESEDKNLIGKNVCIFPILYCGKCEYCAKEEYASCVGYDYYGSRRDGGMCDYICIKNDNLLVLPDGVSFEEGAMTEPTAVCLHAVKKANIKKGESVVVYGGGTIGLLSAMWARYFGAKVYIVDIDQKKLDYADKLGFKSYKGERVDVAIEASGAGACFNQAVLALSNFGRLVLVGNAFADLTVSKENYSKILRKQLSLFGSWNSDFKKDINDWKDSLKAIAEKKIDPSALITHRVALKNGDKAFDVVKNREFYNKIMIGDFDE